MPSLNLSKYIIRRDIYLKTNNVEYNHAEPDGKKEIPRVTRRYEIDISDNIEVINKRLLVLVDKFFQIILLNSLIVSVDARSY